MSALRMPRCTPCGSAQDLQLVDIGDGDVAHACATCRALHDLRPVPQRPLDEGLILARVRTAADALADISTAARACGIDPATWHLTDPEQWTPQAARRFALAVAHAGARLVDHLTAEVESPTTPKPPRPHGPTGGDR